jgi:RNA polymerase sigma-70 factor (ECF subfamily)
MSTKDRNDGLSNAAAQLDQELQNLLERCATSDADALHRLYELVAPLLYACITRILRQRVLAEEALQDAFINIWQRSMQFDAARGRPITWMMAIARNRAIDLLRRERALPPELHSEPDLRDSASNWRPASDLLMHCLELLTGPQRHVIELAFISGASHQEIALITGSPLGTVKSRIRRALINLRNCLESP